MEIKAIIDKRKDIYTNIITFIDCCDDISEYWKHLQKYFDRQKILESKEELKEILCIINKITANHHRDPLFFNKTKLFFDYLKDKIKQTFSNSEIIKIFKNNKRILLQLLDLKIICVDSQFIKFLSDDFCHYFYPDIKSFFETSKKDDDEIFDEDISCFDIVSSKIDQNFLDDFEEKRQEGENESYLCSLIRKDSVIEFISHVNRKQISLSKSKIQTSYFDTNSFLIHKEPSLIEYAAFYGSIQIFQYLIKNEVELTSSLWIYSIHSNNPLLIHILEENRIIPNDKTYSKCYKESVKCHHNDLANYFKNNYYVKDIFSYGFHFHNYEQIPDNINKEKILYSLIKYDYLDLLKALLKNEVIDFNEDIKDEIYKLFQFIKFQYFIYFNEIVFQIFFFK